MSPVVSIGIPTYNGAQYLRECLKSISEQTFKDFEVNIVDDCSNDETVEIANTYASQDPRIAVHLNPARLGLVGNFNRCVALAHGKYVCVFGQDDVMLPKNIAKKVEVLEANPNIGFVHSNIYEINGAGEVRREHWEADSTTDYVACGREYLGKLLMSARNLICCPSVLGRKECFDRLGGFHDQLPYTCDWEMWMRFSLNWDVACLGTALIKYRRHAQSETDRVLNTPFRIEQILLAKNLVLFDKKNEIPNSEWLKQEVKRCAAGEALGSALRAYYEDSFRDSWEFLKLALKVRPPMITEPKFVRLFIRLALGMRCVRAYRRIKDSFCI
jgi:glycosyltransferase involved in cell wall biosynthesis